MEQGAGNTEQGKSEILLAGLNEFENLGRDFFGLFYQLICNQLF